MSAAAEKISGRKKAAILCVSLGSDGAAEIFKQLPKDMVEQLTVEMARTPTVDAEQAEVVLEEFVETAHARGYIAEGGVALRPRRARSALGDAAAEEILAGSRR